MNDLKATEKRTDKTQLFVVLNEGLLFVGDGATVPTEDRLVAIS